MTFKQKILYHQIHPLKLLTDFSAGMFTTYLLWLHDVPLFLVFCLLPSAIISLLLIKFANLQRLKHSPFGRYVAKYMNRMIEAIRFTGQGIMWFAAWYRLPSIIGAGFILIILAWCNGLFYKKI
jgi:hypothetical protein